MNHRNGRARIAINSSKTETILFFSPIFNNRCSSCKREKLGFVERCFAGGVATDILEEPDHNWDDSQFDREQVGKVFPQVSGEREEAFRVGCEQARTTVLQETRAIRALRDALMKKGTDMDGEEAMRVISQARM